MTRTYQLLSTWIGIASAIARSGYQRTKPLLWFNIQLTYSRQAICVSAHGLEYRKREKTHIMRRRILLPAEASNDPFFYASHLLPGGM
jgi:hypothetical protein